MFSFEAFEFRLKFIHVIGFKVVFLFINFHVVFSPMKTNFNYSDNSTVLHLEIRKIDYCCCLAVCRQTCSCALGVYGYLALLRYENKKNIVLGTEHKNIWFYATIFFHCRIFHGHSSEITHKSSSSSQSTRRVHKDGVFFTFLVSFVLVLRSALVKAFGWIRTFQIDSTKSGLPFTTPSRSRVIVYLPAVKTLLSFAEDFF